jgi:hypothetical protein
LAAFGVTPYTPPDDTPHISDRKEAPTPS